MLSIKIYKPRVLRSWLSRWSACLLLFLRTGVGFPAPMSGSSGLYLCGSGGSDVLLPLLALVCRLIRAQAWFSSLPTSDCEFLAPKALTPEVSLAIRLNLTLRSDLNVTTSLRQPRYLRVWKHPLLCIVWYSYVTCHSCSKVHSSLWPLWLQNLTIRPMAYLWLDF